MGRNSVSSCAVPNSSGCGTLGEEDELIQQPLTMSAGMTKQLEVAQENSAGAMANVARSGKLSADALEAAAVAMEAHNSSLQEKTDSLNDELATIAKTMDEKTETLRLAMEKNASLQSTLEDLKRQRDNEMEALLRKTADIVSAKGRKEDLKRDVSDAKAEIKKMKKEAKKLNAMTSDLDSVSAEHHSGTNENMSKISQLQHQLQELKELAESKARLAEERKSMQQRKGVK